MRQVIVQKAQLKVSRDRNEVLLVHGLGGGMVLSLYDPNLALGGLLHFMLPTSKVDARKAESSPGMFADTGIPVLFKEMYKYGSTKEALIVRVAGGCVLYESEGLFAFGQRNHAALKSILARANVQVAAEDVGGFVIRSVELSLTTGQFVVKAGPRERIL